MAKPDSALLDPALYPLSCSIPSRYGDLDPNGHINNVAMTGILEDARVRFLLACVPDRSIFGWQIMAASFNVEYLGQGYYPDAVEVRGGCTHIGRSSFAMTQLARQGDRPVAFAQTVMVWVENDRPAPLPDAFRSAFQPYMVRV